MAVNIEDKGWWKKVHAKLGVDHIDLEFLANTQGLVVNISSSAIKYTHKGETIAVVTATTGAWDKIVKGEIGPASINALGYKVKKAINKVKSSIPAGDYVNSDIPSNAPMNTGSLKKSVKNSVGIDLAQEPDEVGGGVLAPKGMINNLAEDMTALEKMTNKVDLIDANKLYQPVNSTSAGSTYRAIAIGDGVCMAIRLKNTTLSLRVESVKNIGPMLEEIGLSPTTKTKKAHAYSVHLEVGSNPMVAGKCVGAVIQAVNMSLPGNAMFKTPVPDVAKAFS